ncbi:MAG: hypothetical protein RH859_12605 [Longimicrobiales bacterium]
MDLELIGGGPHPDPDEAERARLEIALDDARRSVRVAEHMIAMLGQAIGAADEDGEDDIARRISRGLEAQRRQLQDTLAKQRQAVIMARRELERFMGET